MWKRRDLLIVSGSYLVKELKVYVLEPASLTKQLASWTVHPIPAVAIKGSELQRNMRGSYRLDHFPSTAFLALCGDTKRCYRTYCIGSTHRGHSDFLKGHDSVSLTYGVSCGPQKPMEA